MNEQIFNTLSDTLQALDTKQLAEVFRFVSFEPNELYGPHIHRRIEINYVKRGSYTMLIENENVTFSEGEIMILFSNVQHRFQASEKGCTLMQLEFLPDIFQKFEKLIGSSDNKETIYSATSERKYLKLVNNNEITTSVQAILNELSSNQQNKTLMIVMYYGILLVYVYRRLNEVFIVDCKNDILHDIVAYIRQNYAGQLSVLEIAEHFQITERYMRRLFSKYIGITPNEYINKVRIDKAIEYISDCKANYSIKEVCYMCGFSTPQYFSKIFKQITGLPPRKCCK